MKIVVVGGTGRVGKHVVRRLVAQGHDLVPASHDGRRRHQRPAPCRRDGDPHARYFGTELKGGELTSGGGAHIGAIDFDTWFASQPQEAEWMRHS